MYRSVETLSVLIYILFSHRQFAGEIYDIDQSGSVGWWEFVRCWKENDFDVRLNSWERIFLSIDDAQSCFLARIVGMVIMVVIIVGGFFQRDHSLSIGGMGVDHHRTRWRIFQYDGAAPHGAAQVRFARSSLALGRATGTHHAALREQRLHYGTS